MKSIYKKLENGENRFDCQWNGIPNVCKILTLDIANSQAFVRFETPIKKIIRKSLEPEEVWGYDRDATLPMKDVEVESYEEWVSVKL